MNIKLKHNIIAFFLTLMGVWCSGCSNILPSRPNGYVRVPAEVSGKYIEAAVRRGARRKQ